jgi:hypothetical protein
MDRSILLPFVFILGSGSAAAVYTEASPATYIMQVTSNLSCETLDIELVSQADDTRKNIRFTSSAFSAVEVPSGAYSFGDVICTNEENAQTHDLLSEKMPPLNFSAGQAYYGGRIIFQELVTVDPNGVPDVLDNCTRGTSRARGANSNECRDGVGVNTSAKTNTQINVYLPEVTDEELAVVRNAMSATKEQLLYLPLKP